jgi:5-methylcytosine-specific restriction endonuclease McrA
VPAEASSGQGASGLITRTTSLLRSVAFSESLKKRVRQKAHYRCCLCQAVLVEVHHIVPQEEGGSHEEDNAR